MARRSQPTSLDWYSALVGFVAGGLLIVLLGDWISLGPGTSHNAAQQTALMEALSRVEVMALQLADLQQNHNDIVELHKSAGAVGAPALSAAPAAPSPPAEPVPSAAPAAAPPAQSSQPGAAPGSQSPDAVVPAEAVEAAQSPAQVGNYKEMGIYDLVHLVSRDRNDPRIKPAFDECHRLEVDNAIIPLKSWGKAQSKVDVQQRWADLRCDLLVKGDVFIQEGQIETSWYARFPTELDEQIKGRTQEHSQILAPLSERVVTSVGVATVSRGIKNPSFDTVPLFLHLVPSLVASADPEYELWLYVCYDVGDPFYDRETTVEEIRSWMQEHFVAPLQERGVTAQFALLPFSNELRKPGPAFNYMMRAMYVDGAEYMVRLNDDTETRNADNRSWQRAMIETLRAHTPSNYGVAGPRTEGDNQSIFTHDMVHRTHLEIFQLYYPATLADWWMDDWITRVYEDDKASTRLPDVRWTHHDKRAGNRYEVNFLNAHLLREELALGKLTLRKYKQAKGMQ